MVIAYILGSRRIVMSKDIRIKFSNEEFSGLLHKHSSLLALHAITLSNTSKNKDGYYITLDKLISFQEQLDNNETLVELINDVEHHSDFIEMQSRDEVQSPLARYFQSNSDVAITGSSFEDEEKEIDEVVTQDSDEGLEEDESGKIIDQDAGEGLEEEEAVDELINPLIEPEKVFDSVEELDEDIPIEGSINDELEEDASHSMQLALPAASLENDDHEDLSGDEGLGDPQEQIDIDADSELIDESEPSSNTLLVDWKGIYGLARGRSHVKNETPCQDSAVVILKPRPVIFVSDGAGSASNSHFGSQQVVKHLQAAMELEKIESIQKELLDRKDSIDSENLMHYAQGFISEAILALQELSEQELYPIDSLKCTLLLAVMGQERLFWLKVGDGCIVVENNGSLQLLGPLGKGEFANATHFISKNLMSKDVHYGFIPSKNITGIAVFSDGTAEKLVSTDGLKIAGAVSTFFDEVRENKLTNDGLTDFLEDAQVWAPPWGNDDRSLVLLSK